MSPSSRNGQLRSLAKGRFRVATFHLMSRPSPSRFETEAHALVGRLVMTYSRLDFNLALFVAGWHGPELRTRSLVTLESSSFKSKLDLVIQTVMREHGQRLDCLTSWLDWLDEADRLRCTRNDLIHGRWGVYESRGTVSNIVGLPSSAQREVTYSLEELAEEIEAALDVSDHFTKLSSRWPA